MHGGVVHKEPVLVFTVFSERFAVIAKRDYQRRIVEVILSEPGDQMAEFVVGVGDLAIVEVRMVHRTVGFRRIVWAMRVVKMQPEKKRAPRSFLQPGNGVVHAFSSAAVHQSSIFLLESFRRKSVIIKVEAARQAPTPVENKGADHGSSGIARMLERLGHRAKLRRQRLSGEILHAVLKRVGAGQDHRMGWPCQWDLGNGPLKHDAVMSQRIQSWSLDHVRAITSHMIGAQSIDGDQDNAGPREDGPRDASRGMTSYRSGSGRPLRESCAGGQSDYD